MKYLNLMKKSGTCALLISLSACVSQEEIAQRQSQFNGKQIDQVIATIGQPKRQDSRQAVWTFRESSSNRMPIQHYMNGNWVTTGYRMEEVVVTCTFTAALEKGRVISSTYEGNSCSRFAPPL